MKLQGLKKLRERWKELDNIYDKKEIGHALEWQVRSAYELRQAENQFQSDLRAIEAELKASRILDNPEIDPKGKFYFYNFKMIDALISAIHSALQEGDEK